MKYAGTFLSLLTLAALVAVSFVIHPASPCSWGTWLGLAALGLGMVKAAKDATFIETFALSNGAGTTAQATGFDLSNSADGDFGARAELLIESPALTTTELPDAETMTYDVYHDTASDFGTETLLAASVLVQTGAGGAGDAAASIRVALPDAVKRYVRAKAVKTGTGDVSGKDATVSLVF